MLLDYQSHRKQWINTKLKKLTEAISSADKILSGASTFEGKCKLNKRGNW